jgi:RNA polymerase sigma-70 factor (ECF subfamily)
MTASSHSTSEEHLMRRAMAGLSEDYRNILVLVCVQNRRYAEVSEILQLPVMTVRMRLAEARAELQRLMSGQGGTAPPEDYPAWRADNSAVGAAA